MITLSKEQLEKLEKLEKELEQKRKYEESSKERRIAASKRTGIPYNIVDSDVIRVGMMLGLIKSLDNREKSSDGEKTPSLLDMFLGLDDGGENAFDYSDVPSYFTCAETKCSEADRVEHHKTCVMEECNEYSNRVNQVLKNEIEKIEKVVNLPVEQMTTECFVDNVTATMNVLIEMQIDGDGEYWEQIMVLRNSLLSVMPICEYKKIVTDQVTQLKNHFSIKSIDLSMSYVDGILTLFPGFENKLLTTSDVNAMTFALDVNSHTRDPELKPFNMGCVIKQCATPALLFIPIEKILEHGIVGPYWNNPIGFTNTNFYIMKNITGGVRLWVMDDNLMAFSEELRKELYSYAYKMGETVHGASQLESTLAVLESNLDKLNHVGVFRSTVCTIVYRKSRLIPSDADVFDVI